MKFKLYSTESEWNAQHASVMEALGIPTANNRTTHYTETQQVENEAHADYGKFIFPVTASGPWKCDQLFDGDLVDLDADWWQAPE